MRYIYKFGKSRVLIHLAFEFVRKIINTHLDNIYLSNSINRLLILY